MSVRAGRRMAGNGEKKGKGIHALIIHSSLLLLVVL
jgi:hypothetical protein